MIDQLIVRWSGNCSEINAAYAADGNGFFLLIQDMPGLAVMLAAL